MASLAERVATYFSPPLFPVHLTEAPARMEFHDASESEWQIGGATITSHAIIHPGPTVGFRIEENGSALAYLTDHEPALGPDLATAAPEWISGLSLAFGADVLLHDCQYTDAEYPAHRGWGHSSASQVAIFAARAKVDRLYLFHHDPLHTDDDLDRMRERVRDTWAVEDERCLMAAEGARVVEESGRCRANVI